MQLATVARAYTGLMWVVNPVRESYAVDVNKAVPADPEWKRLPTGRRYACAAYTTLGRHLLAGEERVWLENSRTPGPRENRRKTLRSSIGTVT